MKNLPSTDAFNIVTVGSWNPAIFTPEWAKSNLAEDSEKDVILAIPMQMQTLLPLRLTVDDVNIYPSMQSLVIDCIEYSEASFGSVSRKLARVATLLPHTPVTAIGINFRFALDLSESDILPELFSFGDAARIDSTKYRLTSSVLKRTFFLNDSTLLNISIESLEETFRLEFNFHSEVKRLSEITDKTTADRIEKCRDHAIEFMANVYEIDTDEQTGDENGNKYN